MAFHVPEKYRVKKGKFRGYQLAIINKYEVAGNNGVFEIRSLKLGRQPFQVIASDQDGWEHVSVSLPTRCPTWPEMARIKSLFWDDSDLVIQYHPPKTDYVNVHPFCLHLWRKAGTNDFCERPPLEFV